MKTNALQKIVLKQFPNSKVVSITDTTANPARDVEMSVKKALPLNQLKAHLAANKSAISDITAAASSAARKPSRSVSRKAGPSGIVTIAPNNADGTARRQAKTVVVSRGKVIALQG